MSFSSIAPELQNLLLVEFNFLFKGFFIFGGLFFALFYLFYWKKYHEKPTIFYSVGAVRLLVTLFSFSQITFFPLVLMLLSPELEFGLVLTTFLPIYVTILTLCGVALLGDMVFYIPQFLFDLAGFDTHNPKIAKGKRELTRYFKRK